MNAAILLNLLLALGVPPTIQTIDAAIDLYQHGKFQQAADILTELNRQNPKVVGQRIWLGKAHLKLRRWDDAIREFEQASAIEPNSGLPHLWLGRAYGRKAEHTNPFSAFGLARKTRREFETAARLSPDDVEIRFDLLEFHAQAPGIVGGDSKVAEAQVGEIARVAPRLACTARAAIFENRKDWGRARAELSQAVSKFPDDPGAYVDLAGFLLERGDFAGAETNARKALALDGSGREARMLLAAAQVSLRRNLEESAKALRELAAGPLTDKDPPFETVYYWLGQAYLAQGKKAEAREAFSASLGFDPDNPRSKDALARSK